MVNGQSSLSTKPGHSGFKRLVYASVYSWKGLKAAWKHEAAFRQELVAAVLLSIVAMLLPVSSSDRRWMIFSLALVVIVELLNSAIESVVDRIGNEYHPLAGQAKDMGSAAVLITLLMAVYVWLDALFVIVVH